MHINNVTIINICIDLKLRNFTESLSSSSCFNNQRWHSCTVVWILSFHSLKPGFSNLFFFDLVLGCDCLWLLLHYSVVPEEYLSSF